MLNNLCFVRNLDAFGEVKRSICTNGQKSAQHIFAKKRKMCYNSKEPVLGSAKTESLHSKMLRRDVILVNDKRFIAKKEISVRAMLTILSEALFLPELFEDTEKRNVEFEATLPDVRIDCLLFFTKEQARRAKSGALKELSTINVLHIKAIGDNFTLAHLQTYLAEALVLNSSTQIKPSDQVVLLILCSESFPQVLNGKIFEFVKKQDEPWIYMNKNDWFFPVRILILNDIDLTDENLAIYFPFVPFISNKKKFVEFFPKIATLEIPELWKFYCDLFAQKTNPHYSEVKKMIFQLTPNDMIKAIESVSLENVPEAFNKMLSRFPE